MKRTIALLDFVEYSVNDKIVLYKNLEDCTNRLSDNQHLYEINLTDYDIIVHYDKKNNIYFTMTTIGYHRIKLIK